MASQQNNAAQSHFLTHPLYQNDPELARVTDQLLSIGMSVFQIYQRPPTEAEHSLWLLGVTDPERKARRVLSLGCGVAGMEWYWHRCRGNLRFEFVNISQEQLDRIRCKGRTVRANAETYHSDRPPFDLVVLCYLLGHVNVELTLLSALGNLAPWGRMLVYDIFEGTRNFKETLHYDTPRFEQLEIFGTANSLRFRAVLQDRAQIPLAPYFAQNYGWIALETRPGLFVFQR